MRRTPRIIVAVVMLGVFLASLVVSGLDSKRLAHDLDHGGGPAMAAMVPDHEHEHSPPADGDPDSGPLSNAEHCALHAVNYCPLLPSSMITLFSEAPARTIPVSFLVTVLPPAAPELPFRPPRASALT